MSRRSCDICFDETDNLKSHMKEAHEDSRDTLGFSCQGCDVTFLSLSERIGHHCPEELYEEKTEKKMNLSKVVKRGFKHILPKSVKSIFTKKFKRHRSQDSSFKICEICFLKIPDLNTHMKDAHVSPIGCDKLACPKCGKNFSNLLGNMQHICSPHRETDKIPEGHSKFAKMDEYLLMEEPTSEDTISSGVFNELIDNQPKSNMISCKVCKKRFENKSDLQKHKTTKHQFPCKLCFKKFPLMLSAHQDPRYFEEGWLKKHMQSTHTHTL